jgi:hypothetical protein
MNLEIINMLKTTIMKRLERYPFKCLLLGIFVLYTTISCECRRNADDDPMPELIMTVPKTYLQGKDRSAELTFSVPHDEATADLNHYSLVVGVEGVDEEGHLINYVDKDGKNNMDEKFAHVLTKLSKTRHLNADNKSFTLPITLIPAPDAKEMRVRCHLKSQLSDDPQGLKTIVLTWQDEQKEPGSFVLTPISATTLNGTDKTAQLQIENRSASASGPGQLKLKITRLNGSKATVVGSIPQVDAGAYVLDLPAIQPAASFVQPLVIDPKTDAAATLSLQLQHNGNPVGHPTILHWDQSPQLQLQDIAYDPTTRKITCSLENIGGDGLENITLSCKTASGKPLSTIPITIKVGNLDAGDALSDFEVGELPLDISENVTLQFSLGWEANGVRKQADPVSHTFENKDVALLGLDIQYDPQTDQVQATIQNKGKKTAKDLKLCYENISPSLPGSRARLNGKKAARIALPSLGKNRTKIQLIKADLKGGEQATFRFKLMHRGKEIAQKEETLTSLPISLSFQALAPEKDYKTGLYMLYGSENEIKLKIKENKDGRPIDQKHLKLLINKETSGGGTISTKKAGSEVLAIDGEKLGELGSTLKLYFNPARNQKEAKFSLQLTYYGKPVANPIVVQWKEYNLYIEGSDQLVGRQVATFNLLNSNGYMDLSQLTVSITSDNTATFQLIGLNGAEMGYTSAVDAVVKPNLGALQAGMAGGGKFKLAQAGKEKTAKVTITIKRGANELAKKELDWQAKDRGKEIDLILSSYVINNGNTLQVTLKNISLGKKAIDLSKLRMRMDNTLNIPIRIGNVSGSTINETLETLSGIRILEPQVETTIGLSMDQPLDTKVAAGVSLSVVDAKEGTFLQKKYLICVNARVSQKAEEAKRLIANRSLAELEKESYATINNFLSQLYKVSRDYDILVQQLTNIMHSNSNFTRIVRPIRETYQIELEGWKKLISDLSKIAQSLKSEETLSAWSAETEQFMEQAKTKMDESLLQIPTLEGLKLTALLAAPHNEKTPIANQSIKALYNQYKRKLRSLNDFCKDSGSSTPRGKLPAVRQQMENDLAGIRHKAQGSFNAAFAKFKQDMTQQQATVMVDSFAKPEGLDKLYLQFVAWDELFNEWQKLAKRGIEEIGVEPTQLADFLAKQYQLLSDHITRLMKAYKKAGNKGSMQQCVQLSLKIREQIGELDKNTPTQTVKAARELILKDAKRGTQRARSLSKDSIFLSNGLKKLPRVSERLVNDAKENNPVAAAKKVEKELKKERKSVGGKKRIKMQHVRRNSDI